MKVGDIIWEAQDVEHLHSWWEGEDWVVRQVRVIKVEEGIITVEVVDAPDIISYISPSEIFPSRNAALAWMIRSSNDYFLEAKNVMDERANICKKVSEECARGIKA